MFVVSGQAVLLAPVGWYWWAREAPSAPTDVALLPVFASVTLLPLALLLGVLYHVYFWSVKGATPGKELLDLRVVGEDGRSPIPLASASKRALGYLLSAASLGIGFLMVAFGGARAARPHRRHARRARRRGVEPGRSQPRRAGGRADACRSSPRRCPQAEVRQRFLRAGWEFLHDLSVAVLFCFFLIAFVAQAFRVQGTSMEPLLQDGERIVVNKFVYRFRPIQRGDVVVFWFPGDPQLSFVKRVVGLPGDVIQIRSGELMVNGVLAKESYLPSSYRDNDDLPPTEVQEGLLLRARRPPPQQQRLPRLGRGAREVHLRPRRLPLLAARPHGADPLSWPSSERSPASGLSDKL